LGATDRTLEITSSGEYMVTVTNSNGCTSQSAIYKANYTGIPIIESSGLHCNIYPNPNKGLFTVELQADKEEQVQLKLIAVDGKTIIRKQIDTILGNQSVQFGKENLVKGVYTLQICYGNKRVNRKLVVN